MYRDFSPVLARNWEISRRVFAENLHKVRHWQIIEADYSEAPDFEATWFVDPSYRGSPGLGYRFGNDSLNYSELANLIKSRRGQLIVCESSEADYLPFIPLTNSAGVAGKRNQEAVYVRSGIKGDIGIQ